MKFETISVHTGVDKDDSYNSVTTPIYPTCTFAFEELEKKRRGYDYTRTMNPTRKALEENLAALEGGIAAWATCTGMAAETATMFLFQQGDHIITGRDIYCGTYRMFERCFQQFGLQFSFVDMGDPDQVKQAIRPETKGLWIETPSNPLLNLIDIAAMTEIAHEHNLLTIADNTFLSPYFQRPFEFGVDVIIHSTTKYLNGHSDVVGGAVIVNREDLAERVFFYVNGLGLGCSPFDAWLVLRGVKTLAYRMEGHQKNAMLLAEYLKQHPAVTRVYYPGLKNHPQHELACRQMKGFGGMLSFELDVRKVQPRDFFARLELFPLAESLGSVTSLIEHPWSMSHVAMSEDARREAGISESTVRVSVGLENADDLIADLDQALV